jgi:K+-sensing histidine kinase KdpD
VDDLRLVVGVVATEESVTRRAKRRARNEPLQRVKSTDLRRALEAARELGPGAVQDFEQARAIVLDQMARDPAVHAAVAEQLRGDFDDTLSQSHDFMQLVKLLRGHAENLLHQKRSDLKPEEAAELYATEGAIYFSTELMLLKIDSLTFLREANLAIGDERSFRIHALILKYLRIYRWQANQKAVHITLGNCHATASYNNAAMGAVVQGLLDNLVKYAPAGSGASIAFEESDSEVTILLTSLGPRIEDSEREQIFLPRYRGRAARDMESSGLGVGLASAKAISDVLSLELNVSQETQSDPKYADRFRTTFTIVLAKSA